MSEIIDIKDKWHLLDTTARLFRLISKLNSKITIKETFNWLDEDETEVFNYTQLFKKTIEPSNEMKMCSTHLGIDRMYLRKKRTLELTRDIERAFLYGQRYEDGSYRTTGGLDYFIPTIEQDNPKNRKEFESFMEYVGLHCDSKNYQPYVFTSVFWLDRIINEIYPSGIDVITGKQKTTIMQFPIDTTYGIPIFAYYSEKFSRPIYLIADPMIIFNNDVFVVDLAYLVYRPFVDRDMHIKSDWSADLVDVVICECGLEVHDIKRHCKVNLI